jgi:acetylornithine deacetylase/succinyl-diaminopimelate desuccinylase-like protein
VILLNSHYDVVPVMKEHWTMPAFEGKITDVGGEQRLYGRGAQDMKPVCIQYIVAISRLVAAGVVPRRDVHLSFVPDEETGGSGTYVINDVTMVMVAATAVVDDTTNSAPALPNPSRRKPSTHVPTDPGSLS